MHEVPSPSVIFMDVFSLLTLAMFVLFSVSSGADSTAGKSVLTVIDVRIAILPPIGDKSVSELVEFDAVPEEVAPGPRPRVTVERSEFGLQIIAEGTLSSKLRLVVRRVLDPAVLGSEVRGTAEVQGERSLKVGGRIGAWIDPVVFAGAAAER
ncbi:MAG: hypothetical protein AB7I50_17420 [Vicinamibacterales bacterium]